jgi:acyl carrier protein
MSSSVPLQELNRRFGELEAFRIGNVFRVGLSVQTYLLEMARTREDLEAAIAWLRSLIAQGIVIETPPPPGPLANATVGMTILDRPQATDVFLLFTGRAHRMNLPVVEFLAKTTLLGRNVVVFRDRRDSAYADGISIELPTLEHTILWARGFVAALPRARRLFCVGNSSGAYAAIIAGYHLMADAVCALGLPFPVPSKPAPGPDLRELLAHPNGITRYELHHCEDFARDRNAAESLRGLPGVQLCAHPGSVHAVVRCLSEQGKLAGLFPPQQALTDVRKAEIVTAADVVRLIRGLVGQPAADLEADTMLQGLLDSFATIQLIKEIEKRFALSLDPAALSDADFTTARAICDCLNRELTRH